MKQNTWTYQTRLHWARKLSEHHGNSIIKLAATSSFQIFYTAQIYEESNLKNIN